MSLHFQIDIAFDFKDNVPTDAISALESLSNKQSLTNKQKNAVPTILIEEINLKTDNLSFLGRDIFYFKRHYRYTQYGKEVYRWTFHFRTMLSDDMFYEKGYPLLAWFALYSDTNGFVGYVKEEFDMEPRLLYFDNGEVLIKESVGKKIRFKYADFDTN